MVIFRFRPRQTLQSDWLVYPSGGTVMYDIANPPMESSIFASEKRLPYGKGLLCDRLVPAHHS